MDEVGIDIRQQTSDKITSKDFENADMVITLCHHADLNCPAVPSNIKKDHWPFDDPAGKNWSEFQRVRDEIKARIETFKTTGK